MKIRKLIEPPPGAIEISNRALEALQKLNLKDNSSIAQPSIQVPSLQAEKALEIHQKVREQLDGKDCQICFYPNGGNDTILPSLLADSPITLLTGKLPQLNEKRILRQFDDIAKGRLVNIGSLQENFYCSSLMKAIAAENIKGKKVIRATFAPFDLARKMDAEKRMFPKYAKPHSTLLSKISGIWRNPLSKTVYQPSEHVALFLKSQSIQGEISKKTFFHYNFLFQEPQMAKLKEKNYCNKYYSEITKLHTFLEEIHEDAMISKGTTLFELINNKIKESKTLPKEFFNTISFFRATRKRQGGNIIYEIKPFNKSGKAVGRGSKNTYRWSEKYIPHELKAALENHCLEKKVLMLQTNIPDSCFTDDPQESLFPAYRSTFLSPPNVKVVVSKPVAGHPTQIQPRYHRIEKTETFRDSSQKPTLHISYVAGNFPKALPQEKYTSKGSPLERFKAAGITKTPDAKSRVRAADECTLGSLFRPRASLDRPSARK